MNKFFMTALATVVLAGAGTSCFARLGETEAEIVKRYGKPLRHIEKPTYAAAEKQLLFSLGSGSLRVTFHEGKSVVEELQLVGDDGKGLLWKSHVELAEKVLSAEAKGGKWGAETVGADDPYELLWRRSDKKAFALVKKDSPNDLGIWDHEFMLLNVKANEEAAAK